MSDLGNPLLQAGVVGQAMCEDLLPSKKGGSQGSSSAPPLAPVSIGLPSASFAVAHN